jgi:hypothetical protein
MRRDYGKRYAPEGGCAIVHSALTAFGSTEKRCLDLRKTSDIRPMFVTRNIGLNRLIQLSIEPHGRSGVQLLYTLKRCIHASLKGHLSFPSPPPPIVTVPMDSIGRFDCGFVAADNDALA